MLSARLAITFHHARQYVIHVTHYVRFWCYADSNIPSEFRGDIAHLQQLLPSEPPPQQHRMRSRGSMSHMHPIPFPLQQESRSSKRMMLSHPQPPLPKKPFMICTSFLTGIAPNLPYANFLLFDTTREVGGHFSPNRNALKPMGTG